MVLTVSGYLFLCLSGLAVCLFCWLSYASLTGAARPDKPSRDELLRNDGDITGSPLARF
jgi:hypothetical protein